MRSTEEKDREFKAKIGRGSQRLSVEEADIFRCRGKKRERERIQKTESLRHA